MRTQRLVILKGLRAGLGVSLLALAWCLGGCSALLDFDECSATSDCAALGAGLVCSGEGFCVTPGGSGECSNSACAAAGEGMVCGREGSCVSALTPNCARVAGPIERDNTVILGSVLPTVGDYAGLGVPIEEAIVLALEELNEAGGLPGGRRLVLIGCDDSGNLDQGRAVTQHLVETVGVPVVFGPAFSGIFLDVNVDFTVPNDVMTLSPAATSPKVSELDDDGLAWRTVASDVFQGVAVADLVQEKGWTKVAAFAKDDAYGKGLLDKVSAELLGALGPDAVSEFRLYNDPGGATPPDLASLVTDSLDAEPSPQAVLLLGTSEVVEIVGLFETELDNRGVAEELRPQYILADGGKDAVLLPALLEGKDGLRARVTGTEPDHQNGTIYNQFALRFQQKFGHPASIYTPNSYDATYLAAYAMMTLPEGDEVTGSKLAAAMGRMVTGKKLEAGPDAITEARNTLVGGGTIDFEGASGPLNFDLEVGEAPANVSLWGMEKREDGELRFVKLRGYIVGADGSGAWGP